MTDFFRKLFKIAAPYRVRLILGVIFGILGGLTEPLVIIVVIQVGRIVFPSADLAGKDPLELVPSFLQPVFQSITHWFQSSSLVSVKVIAVMAIPGVVFLRGLFGYLNVYSLQWVAIRTVTDLRTRLFTHLQSLSPSFFTKASTGDLMSRIISDTMALQNVITASVPTIVKDPITVLGLVGVLFAYNTQLTLMTLVVFPLALAPSMIFARKVRKASKAIQQSFSDLANAMHESFTGNRIIKAYNLESHVVGRFVGTSREFIGQYMRVIRSQEIPGPLIEFFGSVGIASLFLYFALQPKPTPEKLVIFAVNIVMMYRPVKNITRLHTQLEQARAASARVFELLATQTTVAEPAQPRPLQAVGKDIQFENVRFSYGEKVALDNISLTVKAGQLVALVGASGSGKTTLANLLLRFYDPQEGSVKIGGTDIREVSTKDLRDHVAVVTQEVILFNETIRRNIAFGKPGASAEEVEQAARHAYAHDFILEKPGGYESVVGEKGVNLSGGQRQRLAIARAIIRDAPILILDEATSALDTESERAVQTALEELMKGRTTLCIAHRLSTIQSADLIVVMEQGRIVDMGTHRELITREGVYRRLHELQFQV